MDFILNKNEKEPAATDSISLDRGIGQIPKQIYKLFTRRL